MNILFDYAFILKLAQLPFVQEIYVYGSRARGTHRLRSDIDLAISCPSATSTDWLKVIEIIEDADTLLPIDFIRLDTLAEGPLKQNIHKDQKLIYRKEPQHDA